MTDAPLIELSDIRKSFGGVRAVDGVGLTLEAERSSACWDTTARVSQR